MPQGPDSNITPRKSLKHLAEATGVSMPTARTTTQLLKLRLYKTTVIHALQPRDPPSRVHFCSCFILLIFFFLLLISIASGTSVRTSYKLN
jgi:hypothetical protein